MFVMHKKLFKHVSLPQSITIQNQSVPVSTSVRNLGVFFDQFLTFEKHISHISKLCYLDIRRISAIRHLLTTNATKVLMCAFILPRLDYCNSLFTSIPNYLIDRLQKIQNHAARLIFQVSKRESAKPLLQSLHWLPIKQRIKYKLSCLSYACLDGSAPCYLSDLTRLYIPSRSLRSSSHNKFQVPRCNLKTGGERTFSFQSAKIWNDLPYSITSVSSTNTFKSQLKTHYFKQHFS